MTFFVRKSALLAAAGSVALWGLAMAAQAGDPPPPAPQQPADAHSSAPAATQPGKPDPNDRLICRDDEETGSRLHSSRVCHTKRQWDQIAKDAQDTLDGQTGRSGAIGPH